MKRNQRVHLLAARAEITGWQTAADRCDRTLSGWIRDRLNDAARAENKHAAREP
jgi:hypothetical protein